MGKVNKHKNEEFVIEIPRVPMAEKANLQTYSNVRHVQIGAAWD